MMKDILVIVVTAVLSDNLVLSRTLGVCPFLGQKGLGRSMRLGLLTLACMCASAAIAWPAERFYLEPHGLTHIRTLVFVLIIASVVQLAETLVRHFSADGSGGFGVYLPLIASNCAIIGVCTQNAEEAYSFAQSLANAAAGGTGFMLALFIFAGIRERIEGSDVPQAFRGIAIDLIAAALVSLSFMGFAGLAGGIFGS